MKIRKTITIDPKIVEAVNKLLKEITPSPSFSAFTAKQLWRAVKEKEKDENEQTQTPQIPAKED